MRNPKNKKSSQMCLYVPCNIDGSDMPDADGNPIFFYSVKECEDFISKETDGRIDGYGWIEWNFHASKTL